MSSAFEEPTEWGEVTFTGPTSGAGIQGSPVIANVDASGQASLTPTANATAGGLYAVTASANGASPSITFSLTNNVGDPSPPAITPVIIGTLGNNGWYTSDVSMS